MLNSGLYPGVVTHARLKPRRHALRYRIFMLLLDLDELEALDRALKLFSRKRFNLVGFDPRRHGDGSHPVPEAAAAAKRPKEIGGPSGPEPTRYGDWEKKGIISDF